MTKEKTKDLNKKTEQEFFSLVNLDAEELGIWLKTSHSKSVGIKIGTINDKKTKPQGPKSIGYASGEHILEILQKPAEQINGDDYQHMRKVVGYIKRHTAQWPINNVEHSRWRYSLMNWGHDPLKQ